MNEHKFFNRTALIELITDRNFSLATENEIMHLFRNIDPDKKEDVAKMLIPLVKQSKNEEEALQKIREKLA